jgi:signal transduction histidine kinase
MIAIVPPSALFSYFAMHRTINRVQALTMATSSLRNSNYAVRVSVKGEDEVAQLQADFNAMAANLESAMHELQEERDTVSSLLQSRRELIASVSHELRTPVATLRGYLETTLIHWDDISLATLHHDLRVMEDEVVHLQKLVEDLFTLARSEVGRLALQCKPTDVGKLIRRIVDASAPLAWTKSKIDLVAEVPDETPAVFVDPVRVEQAIQNLLHNGLRHTPPGGIIAVVVQAEAEAVVIQVKDTGEGIAPQDLPHVWERFYQAESARTGMGSGSGLGLALVKEWVEAMNGKVSVESVRGEGSCFSIRFPLMQQAKLVESKV